MNHEIIEDIKIETIIEDLKRIVELVRIPGSEGSAENIKKYNDDINTPDKDVAGDHIFIVEEEEEEIKEKEEADIPPNSEEEVKEKEEINERVEKVEERVTIMEKKHEELLRELEKYTDKKLKDILVQFKLPVSGVKDVKKKRIRAYLEKIGDNVMIDVDICEMRKCDTCGEEKRLDKENYRVFVYGFKNRCIECDIKSCQRSKVVREDVKTEIKERLRCVVSVSLGLR
jgi:hypothetical protein